MNSNTTDFFSKTELKRHNGATVIFVDDQPLMPMSFTSMDETISFDYIQRLAESGMKLFFQPCDLPWLNQDGLNIDSIQSFLSGIDDMNNGAKVILRVNLHPPMDWLEANPDELVELSDGSKLRTPHLSYYYRFKDLCVYSLVSQKWREAASIELKKLLLMIPKMKGGKNVIGIFLAAGSTGEWGYSPNFSDGLLNGQTVDHSPAFKQYFSSWLTRKYKDNRALQAAWNQSDADLDDPAIPPLESRAAYLSFNEPGPENYVSFDDKIKNNESACSIGGFMNPQTAQDAIDFYQALDEGVTESMVHFARVVKEVSNSKLLTGSFWGASFQLGTRSVLLESADIDFIASPCLYINRLPGEITDTRILDSSYWLHNKIFFVEDDTRTHLAAEKIRQKYRVLTSDDSSTQLKRDFGRNLCNNLYGWWFDMQPSETLDAGLYSDLRLFDGKNWYDSPEILRLFEQQQQIAKEAFKYDRSSVADIAVIMDERAAKSSSYLYHHIIQYWKFAELARSGMAVDFYYYDDLDNPDMPDYKLYVFANTYTLTNNERDMISSKVKKEGTTVLWLYGCGIINPDAEQKFSVDNITQLIGINTSYDPACIEPEFSLIDTTNPLLNGATMDIKSGGQNRKVVNNEATGDYLIKLSQMPNAYPDDAAADVLGFFDANNKPALAVKDCGGWRSVYCAAMVTSSDLFRTIARNAGCHVYCDSDDFIFINKSYITIHAASGGRKTINFPEAVQLREVYEETSYREPTKTLTIQMEKGATKTFHIKQQKGTGI